MTDTGALRVALLTELGWRLNVQANRQYATAINPETGDMGIVGANIVSDEVAACLLPPLDANLIAKSRLLLVTSKQRNAYLRELQIVISDNDKDWFWECINATPDQHAAAILSALGKLPKDL